MGCHDIKNDEERYSPSPRKYHQCPVCGLRLRYWPRFKRHIEKHEKRNEAVTIRVGRQNIGAKA